MAHLTGGLWHFWGSGSAGSYANRRRLRGVVSLSHAIASLEAGKSSPVRIAMPLQSPRRRSPASPHKRHPGSSLVWWPVTGAIDAGGKECLAIPNRRVQVGAFKMRFVQIGAS
jgi:hypothetical protein